MECETYRHLERRWKFASRRVGLLRLHSEQSCYVHPARAAKLDAAIALLE
jgi:hypothetical protein